TAEDPNGNLATAYNGDHGVTFSGAGTVGGNNPSVTAKSGSAVAFGSSTTLTFTNGVATAGGSLVLVKAEGATIVATAGAITTTGADRLGVTVSPSSTTALDVSTTAGSPQTAGAAFDVTVTARDQFGNTTPGYTGTVGFGSTDAQAVVPAAYQFVAGDNGTKSFPGGVTLKTAGGQTVSATDQSAGSITGSASVSVAPAATTHFTVSTGAANPQTAGAAFSATVTARDQFGNVA